MCAGLFCLALSVRLVYKLCSAFHKETVRTTNFPRTDHRHPEIPLLIFFLRFQLCFLIYFGNLTGRSVPHSESHRASESGLVRLLRLLFFSNDSNA